MVEVWCFTVPTYAILLERSGQKVWVRLKIVIVKLKGEGTYVGR